MKHKPDSWMWVDQLSIDQSQTEEPNHQVALMHAIYTSASSVIVWLGDGPAGASNGMLQWLQTKPDQPIEPELQYEYSREELQHYKPSWAKLVMNPYWDRLWIMQELLLASQVQFATDTGLCAMQSLPYMTLGNVKDKVAGQYLRVMSWYQSRTSEGPHLESRGNAFDLSDLIMGSSTKRCPGSQRQNFGSPRSPQIKPKAPSRLQYHPSSIIRASSDHDLEILVHIS